MQAAKFFCAICKGQVLPNTDQVPCLLTGCADDTVYKNSFERFMTHAEKPVFQFKAVFY